MKKLIDLLNEINEGSLYSSQTFIKKLTPKIEKDIESLKKGFPHYDINLIKNSYENDNSYTLSILGKNTKDINDNKLERAIEAKFGNSVNEIEEKDNKKVVKKEPSVVDEIGKFYVVKKPKKGMTKEEMVCESTVFDEIKMDEVKGVYKNRSEANRMANESLMEYEKQLKEMEDAMNEFRSAKNDIEEKRKTAAEKVKSLK